MLKQRKNKTMSIRKLQDSILTYLCIEKTKHEYRQRGRDRRMRIWKRVGMEMAVSF